MQITEKVLDKIGETFGITLYPWQKDYISGKTEQRAGGRCNGKTFAYCVKLLLSDGEKIRWSDVVSGKHIDEHHEGKYKRWFADFMREVNEQLVSAGFETRLEI